MHLKKGSSGHLKKSQAGHLALSCLEACSECDLVPCVYNFTITGGGVPTGGGGISCTDHGSTFPLLMTRVDPCSYSKSWSTGAGAFRVLTLTCGSGGWTINYTMYPDGGGFIPSHTINNALNPFFAVGCLPIGTYELTYTAFPKCTDSVFVELS